MDIWYYTWHSIEINLIRSIMETWENFLRIAATLDYKKGKNAMYYKIIGLVLLVLAGFYFFTKDGDSVVEQTAVVAEVELVALQDLSATKDFVTAGTVEAISEAVLKAEYAGQITSVATDLGKYVTAGAVVATIENRAQYAQLLQAEGAYEAAEASSVTGDVGVREAELRLLNAAAALESTGSSVYGVAQSVLFNTIDSYYSNPSGLYPTLKISTQDSGEYLRDERRNFQDYLKEWQALTYFSNGAVIETSVAFSVTKLDSMISIVDTLIAALNHFRNDDRYTTEERSAENVALSVARQQLVGAKTALTETVTSYNVAKENLDRAKVSASSGTASFSDAQLKQALGALRAAQANYEKTLVRSPIAGVVNALYIKKGDYVSPLEDVALIANNGGLQVTTSISEADSARISIGDTVTVNEMATGTISAIGGAVDPKTGKIAVKVSVSDTKDLANGTAVRVRFATNEGNSTPSGSLYVPLTAVKLTANGALLYGVTAEKTLFSIPVELGMVAGDTVEVLTSIDAMSMIVLDVRGRKVGELVSVKAN